MIGLIRPLLATGLLAPLMLHAQERSSIGFRHASGAGPFPIYLAFQWVHNSNQAWFERLVNPDWGERWRGCAGRVRMRGLEVNAGFILNEDRILGSDRLRLHSSSFEVGWKYLERVRHDDAGHDLRLRQGIWSARIGYRANIYYPITLHVQGGLVFVHRVSTTLDGLNMPEPEVAISRTPYWTVCGIDTRARLVFFDPVGSGGGLSLFVEGQLLMNLKRPSTQPFAELLDAPEYSGGSLTTGVLSIGTTIPLALRVR